MIILDTHTLVWWVSNPEKLSAKSRKAIEGELKKKKEILVSSISVWEICLLVKKERLQLTMDIESWIDKISQLSAFKFIAVDNQIAAKSVNLPGVFHDDPADRMIVATALESGASLITSDKRIRKYSPVRSIW
ncbi:type II toxin-antitoxin system VapC family toxin [Candidatus Microgenomates bacterium]|nr:type II toxin-antitoxin system VapC family toxin [Candidatus Microgenomates bacterium]